MNLSEIDFIQVVVRIRGKYHMVLLNEATELMLPELIVGMEGKGGRKCESLSGIEAEEEEGSISREGVGEIGGESGSGRG